MPVEPGRLFVVGDPKQSIYRFRRADIGTFLEAERRFGAEAGGPIDLSANFRTVAPIIDWVNDTFGMLMSEPPDTEVPVPSQPELRPSRRRASERRPPVPRWPWWGPTPTPPAPAPSRFERPRHATSPTPSRSPWRSGGRCGEGGDGWRHPTLGDITILVPARTSLPFLEDALETAGIPFRTESSSLVYASRAVRDLLMVLRAADDPTDQLKHRVGAAHPAPGLRRRRPLPLQGGAARQLELQHP